MMKKNRQLRFLFQEPGMLEAVATEPEPATEKLKGKQSVPSRGYSDSYIPDLMVDYRVNMQRPFAWISYNFHKTYPLVIWGLKLLMNEEMFDLPQAGLTDVPLHEAFSWAYTHYILADHTAILRQEPITPPQSNLTCDVLHYAAVMV